MDDLTALSGWFFGNITENPDQPIGMADRWYSVAMDIGMYLSELIIEHGESELRWEMVTKPKRDMSYQRPVVRGFNVSNPLYNIDLAYGISVSGHAVLSGTPIKPHHFAETFDYYVEKAKLNRDE